MPHVEIKEGLTTRQIERQKVRENGKYSKYPTCELCGKKIPSDSYWSDPRCNITGTGLLLCKKCCQKSEKMNNTEFIKTFEKNTDTKQRIKYIYRLGKEFPDRI